VPVGDQRWYISYDRAYKGLETHGYRCQLAGYHRLTVVELQSLVEVLAAEQTIAETAMRRSARAAPLSPAPTLPWLPTVA
jgi:hypothetical protein